MDRGAVMAAYLNASRWRRDNPAATAGLLLGRRLPATPRMAPGTPCSRSPARARGPGCSE